MSKRFGSTFKSLIFLLQPQGGQGNDNVYKETALKKQAEEIRRVQGGMATDETYSIHV